MNWKTFLLLFVRNIVLGVVLGAVALDLFGYLIAGLEGFANAAYWGAILGLIGGVFSRITFCTDFGNSLAIIKCSRNIVGS